jgi:hypothetical protein
MPRPTRTPRPRAETDLYAPVKALLEAHGYVAKGEIKGCDIVAIGPVPEAGGDPPMIVVEMKLALTLGVLLQAVDRFALTESVYIAVPSPDGASGLTPYDPRLHRLCRRLGLGLIAVEPVAGGAMAVPVLDPLPPGTGPRRNKGRAALVRREHARRLGDPNRGGTPGRVKLITAYRQAALRCAAALRDAGGGPLAVGAVRGAAGVEEAGKILYRNVYGWFEPVGRNAYRLAPAGRRDLDLQGVDRPPEQEPGP